MLEKLNIGEKQDKSHVLSLLDKNPGIFRKLPQAFRDNLDICIAAAKSRYNLDFMGNGLNKNIKILKEVLFHDPDYFEHLEDKNYELCMHLLSFPNNIDKIKFMENSIRDDSNIVKKAVKNNIKFKIRYTDNISESGKVYLNTVKLFIPKELKGDMDFIINYKENSTDPYHKEEMMSEPIKKCMALMSHHSYRNKTLEFLVGGLSVLFYIEKLSNEGNVSKAINSARDNLENICNMVPDIFPKIKNAHIGDLMLGYDPVAIPLSCYMNRLKFIRLVKGECEKIC